MNSRGTHHSAGHCVLKGAVCGLLLSASAAPAQPRVEQVKAVFLYQFTKFVVWPPLPESGSFALCVLGSDPFGPILDELARSEQILGRPLQVRHLRAAGEAGQCQVVFIAASEAGRLEEILTRLRGLPVLTVGDFEGFIRRGGMIGMTVKDQRVRFEVNLQSARLAGLQFSAQLLKLADTVLGRYPHEEDLQ